MKQHQLRTKIPILFPFCTISYFFAFVNSIFFSSRAFSSKFSVVYAMRSIVCLCCVFNSTLMLLYFYVYVLGARALFFYRWFTASPISSSISTFNSKCIVSIMGKKYVTCHVTVSNRYTLYWLLILLHRIQCDCEMNICDLLLFKIISEQQLRWCVTIYTLHLLQDVNFLYRLWNFCVSSFCIFVCLYCLTTEQPIELNYFSSFFLDSFYP